MPPPPARLIQPDKFQPLYAAAGGALTSYSLYGTAGFNLGARRLRSDYQYSRFDSGGAHLQSDSLPPQT